MDGGSSNKRQVEAQREGESSTKRQSVTMGLETLDCLVCSEPLRPPIFQCSMGHFICSSCLSKLLDKKCHVCSVKTSFKRCFGMEHVVQSVIVPCSNAKYGCAEKVAYYQKEEHEKACPNSPCFCPESGCSFTGPAKVLVGHLATKHKCCPTTYDDANLVDLYLYLQPGLHVLHCYKDSHFFLFNMASEPFGHAISVVCVQPKVMGPKFTCDMDYNIPTTGDSQSSYCKIRNTSLSDGLPTGYDLIVPKGKVSGEGNGIMIRATIRGDRGAFYEADADGNDFCYSDSEDDKPLASRARLN